MAIPTNLVLQDPNILVEDSILSDATDITLGRFSNCAIGIVRQVYSGYTAYTVDDVILYKKIVDTSFEQDSTRFNVIIAEEIIAKSTYTPPPPET